MPFTPPTSYLITLVHSNCSHSDAHSRLLGIWAEGGSVGGWLDGDEAKVKCETENI